MAAKAEPPTRVLCLIAAEGAPEPHCYLAPHGPALGLPAVSVALPSGLDAGADAIARAVRAQYGLAVEFLLAVSRATDDPAAPAVVLLVALPGSRPVAGDLTLLSLAAARRAAWADPAQRDLLDVLAEPAAPNRVAWARPGFLAEAHAWLTTQLAAHGLSVTGPLQVRRHWSLSVLLRVPTNGGDVYFKAVPPVFQQEPRLTQFLALRFPSRVPGVLAIDPERRWLLMPAFTGDPLQGQADPAAWLSALRGYADLQAQLVADALGLLPLGCPDRRAAVLAGQVDEVLAATDAMRIGLPRGLTPEQATQVTALGPALRQACRAFAALPLPPTLEHGDLHGGNIVSAPAGGWLYYDWTDGCLAPPFFGLPTYLENAPADLHPALIEAYAEPWRAFADASTLAEARRLARPLSDLHIALSYVWIHAHTEPRQRWQLAGALPYFLRELLRHAPEAGLA